MKTITEFAGSTLQNAMKTKKELLAAGKTAEELPAAMGEALKLEGDKLTLVLSAIEVVEKNPQDLKRVVVWSLQEGEKAPRGTEQKGEHYFGVEYFPPMPGKQRGKHGKGRGGDRDQKRDRKGGRRGSKRGERGDRNHRSERGERRAPVEGQVAASGGGETSGEGGEKSRRRRRPHGPRKEGAPSQLVQAGAPKTTGKIIPRVKPDPATKAAASAPAPVQETKQES